jgi:hypothetical protein
MGVFAHAGYAIQKRRGSGSCRASPGLDRRGARPHLSLLDFG